MSGFRNSNVMSTQNPNARLETFCDGVFAIAMTLLIIDIKVPEMEGSAGARDVWRALRHLGPSIFAFVLSFGIVLITWVNHHNALRLVHKSTASFIYANGFLLLTVVVLPFPTALLGAFIATDHAAPAVVLYNAVLAVQAGAWLLMWSAALRNHLVNGERATATARELNRNAVFAIALYSLLAITALWFPRAVAVVTTATWVFWLALGVRLKPPGDLVPDATGAAA
jgi:TMEM175 potassium channel family protein